MYNIVSILEATESHQLFRTDALNIKLLDPEEFIKKNPSTKEITNHITFIRNGVPSPDGLLSNEIFGITKEERSGIYGYINLNGWFMQPFLYKIWSAMDKRIKNIAHSTTKYSINEEGDFVEDPHGGTGMDWLRKNIDRVKIRSTESRRRDSKITVLENNKDVMFIRKLIVIPPMYRDVSNAKGKVEIGSINKYYQSIILTASSIKDRQEMFGVEAGEVDKGRLQELLVSVYKALSGTSTDPDDGVGLGKDGIMENAGKSKTTDYGTRLVITAPNLRVESLDDMMVDIKHSAVPLASALVNFKGYVIFYMKRFFDNEFGGMDKVQVCDDQGNLKYAEVKDYRTQFSDQVIEQHIESFIYGFSNRLEAVSVEVVNPNNNKKPTYMKMVFKGRHITPEQYAAGDIEGESSLINRPLTWCDILYMAAVEATRDKHVLITRYPIDSIYNQFPTKITISTLDKTEPIYINKTFYRFYPMIRAEDIGKDTSNMFKDTMNICNLFLGRIVGDYDGDTVGDKGVYIKEANDELDAYINSKINYIGLDGNSSLSSSNEALHSIYSLTNVLKTDVAKLSVPKF